MRLPPDLRTALAALGAALGSANPRGPAVQAAARAVGRAARAARHTPAELLALLGRTVLPPLRAQHPGPGGDWLWTRALDWVRAAYADAGLESTARGAALGADARVGPVAPESGRWRVAPAAGPARWEPGRVRPSADAPVVYQLDARDVVTRVNAAWRAFAVANGAPGLEARVVGASLWAHVTGEETRRVYEAVYAAVRQSGHSVTLRFRCDAPSERRRMRMSIRPLGGGGLRVTTAVMRRAPRAPVLLLDPAAPRGAAWVRLCSLCTRARDATPDATPPAGDGPALLGASTDPAPLGSAWIDVELLAAARMAADRLLPQPRVHYDVCPDCVADIGTAIDRLSA